MGKFELRFKRSVSKDLRKLPAEDISRILRKFDELSENPRGHGAKKLRGDSIYRARVGDYGILYEILETRLVIHVIKVAHRSSAYR